MLTWTEDDYECDFFGSPKTVKRLRATANGQAAYHTELMSDGHWALFREWTKHLVTDDSGARVVAEDVGTIKAKAEEDLRRWRDVLDELTEAKGE